MKVILDIPPHLVDAAIKHVETRADGVSVNMAGKRRIINKAISQAVLADFDFIKNALDSISNAEFCNTSMET